MRADLPLLFKKMYKDENYQITREIKLFIEGIKPILALYFPYEENRNSTLHTYPLEKFLHISHSEQQYIYFQNESYLNAYVENYIPIVEDSNRAYDNRQHNKDEFMHLEAQRLAMFGLLLGFPPLAVKAYVQDFIDGTYRKHHKRKCDIVVNYYGIHFGTKKEYLDEDLSWLENKYRIPEYLKRELWICNEIEDCVEIHHVSEDRIKEFDLDRYDNVFLKS